MSNLGLKSGIRRIDYMENGTPAVAIPAAQLGRLHEDYLSLHCYNQSPATLANKRAMFALLLRFLEQRGHDYLDRRTAALFLAHVRNGHLEPDGRYGLGETHPRYRRPTRPRTLQLHYVYLQAFCKSLVEDGLIAESPLAQVEKPSTPPPMVQPFTVAQVGQLLQAARKSHDPSRNVAILTMLFDTGLRAAELCSLRHCDVDLAGHHCVVTGKGNRERIVRFGDAAAESIIVYLRSLRPHIPAPDAPLFSCDRGASRPLAVSSLRSLFRRLGQAAGLHGVRCSPHTMRHSFATEFMLSGAGQRATMAQLGHSTPHMTLRYQHIVDAQLAEQHRANSPADRLRAKRGKS